MTTYIDDIEFDVSYSYYKSGMLEDIILTAIFNHGTLAGQTFVLNYNKLPDHVRYRIENEIVKYEESKKIEG